MGFEFLFLMLLLITCGEIVGPLSGVDEPVLTNVTLFVKLRERYVGTMDQGFGKVG
jgi:hypothetical protein